MKLFEIKSLKLKYHKTLNPKLWSEKDGIYVLDPKVKAKLLTIAKKFIDTLDLKDAGIDDYVITGSNCNYNWTKQSDLDMHVLIRQDCKKCDRSIEDCLKAKKTLWNDKHEITIYDIPVEAYATTASEKLVQDSGTYSLLKDRWINIPEKKKISIDAPSIKIKADEIASEIDQLISSKSDDEHSIRELLNKIKRMRQAGLDAGGEFSVENLAFKTLRNNGYIDKIRKYSVKAQDNELSLK